MNQDNNKVVIITGAGSGIGRATAIKFSDNKYKVLVTDISGSDAENTCKLINDRGGESLSFTGDVSSQSDCHACAQFAYENWDRIDVLIANAGVQTGGSLNESTEDDWENIIAVNLKGVAYSCNAVIPTMARQKSGAIVITSSINAIRGSAGMAIYDASKAGVLGLMRNLAVEHGGKGIRVNAICPGNTITDFHIKRMAEKGISVEQIREMTKGYGLLGRAAEPEEIASAIYFLAADEASFITGQTLVVDGGFSVTGATGS